MASSIVLNIPIFVLSFLFITCSFVAPAPETWAVEIHNMMSNQTTLYLKCDRNGAHYPPLTLTKGRWDTFTFDVDLPRSGGNNYVFSCFMDYEGSGKYNGYNWVFFDYERDKSRCANKRCIWHINENGAFLVVRGYV
ncbi:hypothetical protein BC332_32051 [Capsicum chinense]|nr:hypothetical protein BC332_32051 [Capsicum chinense]